MSRNRIVPAKPDPEPDPSRISAAEAWASFLSLMGFVDTLPGDRQNEFYDLMQEWRRTEMDEDRERFCKLVKAMFDGTEPESGA